MQLNEISGDIPVVLSVAGTAAGTDVERPSLVLPWDAMVQSVAWVPGTDVTADDTNYATITLYNRGDDGTGTTAIASRVYSATDSSKDVAEDMTLATDDDDLALTAGDVLSVAIAKAGTGLAIPAGVVQVTLRLA